MVDISPVDGERVSEWMREMLADESMVAHILSDVRFMEKRRTGKPDISEAFSLYSVLDTIFGSGWSEEAAGATSDHLSTVFEGLVRMFFVGRGYDEKFDDVE